MNYTDSQLERYSRHIILKDVGLEGQVKISEAKVLVIGSGGLGSPALLYLAAAGVGTIGVADGDVVDLSNLQRQIIHSTNDIGNPKVLSAKEKINNLNPDVNVITYQEMLTTENIAEVIQEYDFIIDGTDNFPAKFLVNDACYFGNKPFSHAGILKFFGQTITVLPGTTTCYRCIFREPPPLNAVPSCSQAGVIGVIAGVLGTLQAGEAIKYILGKGDLITNRLLTFDALDSSFRDLALEKNPECPICGEHPEITELMDYEQAACKIG